MNNKLYNLSVFAVCCTPFNLFGITLAMAFLFNYEINAITILIGLIMTIIFSFICVRRSLRGDAPLNFKLTQQSTADGSRK